jgi:SAM-dependent methyltransferase
MGQRIEMSVLFHCRSCGSRQGFQILDLGLQPLANNLLTPTDLGKPEPKFPLRLGVCRSCWLLQILDLVPPTQLFSEYLYFSSFSDFMLRHAKEASEKYASDFGLGSGSLVVEVASNDGYFLQNFKRMEIPCLGIEPAGNIAKVAREKGIETIVKFFGAELGEQLAASSRRADLILGNNVFAHVPNPNDFVAGLRALIKPHGRIILEFPYAVDFLEQTEFDTIYHEHVFYFSLLALEPLFARHGLQIYDVEKLSIHGGSLRIFAASSGEQVLRPAVLSIREEEMQSGLTSSSYYEGFARRVYDLKRDLITLLNELKQAGKSIAAYGASAKGSTLLNFFGIGKETLNFVADRSTYKQGKLTPGTHLTIVPPDELSRLRPDYTLLLTWNFAEEIMEQQYDYRRKGGKFIVPIPAVKVV